MSVCIVNPKTENERWVKHPHVLVLEHIHLHPHCSKLFKIHFLRHGNGLWCARIHECRFRFALWRNKTFWSFPPIMRRVQIFPQQVRGLDWKLSPQVSLWKNYIFPTGVFAPRPVAQPAFAGNWHLFSFFGLCAESTLSDTEYSSYFLNRWDVPQRRGQLFVGHAEFLAVVQNGQWWRRPGDCIKNNDRHCLLLRVRMP